MGLSYLSTSPDRLFLQVRSWFYAGTGYVWLAQPTQAQKYTAEAIERCDKNSEAWPVSRVLARIDQGLALLKKYELEEASALGIEALDLSIERLVTPIRRRAAELREALQAHRGLSVVRDFEERYRMALG